MDLRIDQPIWLLLAIPIVIYISWFLKKKTLQKREHWVIFFLRFLAVFCLLFAVTRPYITFPNQEEQVVFLVDRSASLKGTDTDAASWIEKSLQQRKNSQYTGIYSFAKGIQTEFGLTKDTMQVTKWQDMADTSETNIASALQLVTNMLETNKATRVILLSDGLETAGSVENQLNYFKHNGIQIDTVLLKNDHMTDAAITNFQTPNVAYAGEEQSLHIQVETTEATDGELLIALNDETIAKKKVSLDAGKNTVTFKHIAKKQGLLKYEATLKVANDSFLENNKWMSVTNVEGQPRVLLVHGDGKSTALSKLIGQKELVVKIISASELPSTQTSYLQYDAIIFDNVPGHEVGEAKMGMIEQSVKNFGIGFMMTGGDSSYGLGGYFKTPIEKLLPVEMEVKGKEQLPSLGLVIVMDRSGSMTGNKIELAKEAAARSVELLRKNDTFGFIAFDDRPWSIIDTAPLKNKKQAIADILSVSPEGGTEIFQSLQLAYQQLEPLKLQRKHIILLTDGQSSTSSSYEQLIEGGKKSNITLSTVAIGDDADRRLLEELARFGTGRFYDVRDEETVPSILSRETSMMTRTYIEDNPFYPMITSGAPWNALFTDGVPQMNAYIATTAKQTSKVIAKSNQKDPVIAEWNYGLGKSIAYTSDTSGKWAGDWARWDKWSRFWNTAVSEILPSYDEVPYTISQQSDGSYLVTDATKHSAFMDIAVVDDNGEKVEITEEAVAPGKTKVYIDHKPGLVYFSITNEDDGMYKAGVTIPYSKEYQLQQPNSELLKQIADTTGGKVLKEPSEAFRKLPKGSFEQQNITTWFLLIAMILFFIDITLRRFGWQTIRGIFMRGNLTKVKKTEEIKRLDVEALVKNKKK
ncbi:VWA domain-containing protein [Rummeliibacillus sp. NPDC094406]|uniref:VWA domain-containing protein n=1 Tax=Rummeliibacillus sp. NPDC094406 TaxID=3364511 RepID=UPI003815531B